jgi:hypothetical protein
MSTDRDVTRIVRSWLDEGATQLPDRVLDEVLVQLPTTRQSGSLTGLWRPTMSSVVRFGLAGAVIVAIGLGTMLLSSGNFTGNEIRPSSVASASQRPQALPGGVTTSAGGRYAIQLPHAPIDAVMTLDEGWTSGGWFIQRGGAAVIFFTPENVNGDACRQDSTLPAPAIGPSVDDFLAALGTQKNSEMSAPVDVTVGGVAAKRIEIAPSPSVPCPAVRWWKEPCCGDPAFRGADVTEADRSPDTVWVLEANGQRVAVVGYWDHSDTTSGNDITHVVNSLGFVARRR